VSLPRRGFFEGPNAQPWPAPTARMETSLPHGPLGCRPFGITAHTTSRSSVSSSDDELAVPRLTSEHRFAP
jgi:hypothetical protein